MDSSINDGMMFKDIFMAVTQIESPMPKVIKMAVDDAVEWHWGQKRKFSNLPYVTHPMNVMRRLWEAGIRDTDVLVAGLFHDVKEDTKFFHLIEPKYGTAVAHLVEEVSNVAPKTGTRRERFETNLNHLASASSDAKSIKLGDIYDNCSTIVESDREFAKIYIPEKKEVLTVLEGGNQYMWDRTYLLLMSCERRLL